MARSCSRVDWPIVEFLERVIFDGEDATVPVPVPVMMLVPPQAKHLFLAMLLSKTALSVSSKTFISISYHISKQILSNEEGRRTGRGTRQKEALRRISR
jgi:hypothetical protein